MVAIIAEIKYTVVLLSNGGNANYESVCKVMSFPHTCLELAASSRLLHSTETVISRSLQLLFYKYQLLGEYSHVLRGSRTVKIDMRTKRVVRTIQAIPPPLPQSSWSSRRTLFPPHCCF
jgi:hypothetical protein